MTITYSANLPVVTALDITWAQMDTSSFALVDQSESTNRAGVLTRSAKYLAQTGDMDKPCTVSVRVTRRPETDEQPSGSFSASIRVEFYYDVLDDTVLVHENVRGDIAVSFNTDMSAIERADTWTNWLQRGVSLAWAELAATAAPGAALITKLAYGNPTLWD